MQLLHHSVVLKMSFFSERERVESDSRLCLDNLLLNFLRATETTVRSHNHHPPAGARPFSVEASQYNSI